MSVYSLQVWALLLLCTALRGQVEARMGSRLFEALDCAAADGISDYALPAIPSCDEPIQTEQVEEVEMDLIRKSTNVELKVTVCNRDFSRTIDYCGNYDHETMMRNMEIDDVRQPTTLDQCREWVKKKTFRDERGNSFNLTYSRDAPSSIMRLKHMVAGKTEYA